MKIAKCPDCENEVEVSEGIDLGDIVSCDDCGSELEVSAIDPLEFDLVEEEDSDEDDEDEF